MYSPKIAIIILGIAALALLPTESHAAETDLDHDGLDDVLEVSQYRTDPQKMDTDGDGFSDGEEIKTGYSPIVAEKRLTDIDTDGDGASDAWEIAVGTDLNNTDSDYDGFSDGEEIKSGHNPKNAMVEKLAKRIVVNLKAQTLTYYLGEAKLEEFSISSGLTRTPTPPGTYTVVTKRPIVHYVGAGYNYPNTKWNLMFKPGKGGSYYIHGAYWHNKFGTPRSHGCVNVAYTNMERLYTWADVGTPISITQ